MLLDTLWEQRKDDEAAERLLMYRRNWNYYQGNHVRHLKVKPGQPDDNVIVNLCRLIVDKGASFLFGKEVQWQLDAAATTPEEEALDEVWAANQKQTFLGKLAVTGGVCGHVFIKIMPDGAGPGGKLPRLVLQDPAYVTVTWSPEDIETVLRYRIEWTAQAPDGKPVQRREDIELVDGKWIITEYTWIRGRYEIDPNNPPLTWKYDWPPMVDSQNIPMPLTYYGASDLEDIALQDAINFTASNMLRILRYHAHPKTWGRGFGAADVETGADDLLIIRSPDGTVQNLEMQSDLASSQAYLDKMINRFLGSARLPRLEPSEVSVGALSGFALQILYGDLLEKTEMKRCTYGDMLIELNRRLLEMMGHGADQVCTIIWPDPLPTDEAAEQTRDQFELDYKLASLETVRDRRGLDNDDETARLEQEDAANGNVGAALMRAFQTKQTLPPVAQPQAQPVTARPIAPAV